MDCLAFFITVVLLAKKSCTTIKVEGKHVDSTVKLASTMTLECVYPKTATITQMSWRKEKDNGKKNIVVFKLPRDLYIESRYAFRVHVGNETTSNKSLIFNNTTEEDIGFYLCSFQTFPYGTWEKRIQVVRSDEFNSRVFLDPHAMEGSLVAKPGEKVTMTHWHGLGIIVNQVIWERVQIDHVDHIGQCLNSAIAIYGSDYPMYRAEIHCATQANSTLVLRNVTVSDSGIYRCYLIGENGKNETGWTKLTISSNVLLISVKYIVLISGAAIILLVIISAIVVTILQHRKKENKRKMKAFHIAQTQLSHNYEESGHHPKGNARRGQNVAAFGATETPIYMNCKNVTNILHRLDKQV